MVLGGEVLGLAPGLGLLSWSLAPLPPVGEPLDPLAVATSFLAPPGPAVPLSTVAEVVVFALAVVLRWSPGCLVLPFFALDGSLSPGLVALVPLSAVAGRTGVPSPSDFMVLDDAAVVQLPVPVFLKTRLVLWTGGLSHGAAGPEAHLTPLGCELVKTGFFPSLLLSPLSRAAASICSLCLEGRVSHPRVWRTA